MYAIHVTEGIVIDIFESGEVDCFYYIYTKDYGLLGLLATGVRLQKSKLKSTLQSFSHIEIGFVKGKNTLRLMHATMLNRVSVTSKQRFLARLFHRLRRMVSGQDSNIDLYHLLVETINTLDSTSLDKVQDKYGMELLYTIRLLDTLGYWAPEIGDEPFLNAPITKELISETYNRKLDFVPRVQKATEETQL